VNVSGSVDGALVPRVRTALHAGLSDTAAVNTASIDQLPTITRRVSVVLDHYSVLSTALELLPIASDHYLRTIISLTSLPAPQLGRVMFSPVFVCLFVR